jgi:hypothetical protein
MVVLIRLVMLIWVKGTAASLGISKMKILVKMMKQVKMIKLMIMWLMNVSGFRANLSQS